MSITLPVGEVPDLGGHREESQQLTGGPGEFAVCGEPLVADRGV